MDIQLLLALVLGIAAIVVVVLRTRLDAFVALLLAALLTGVVAGQDLTGIVASISTGFGNTLGSIGIVIGLGVAIGKILEVSGGADALARTFLKAFGKGREEWAMASAGSLVSIPVFCDSGYVIMNPLARSIARVKRAGYVSLALSLGAGMTLTHHLVPPTPVAVTGILGADLGLVIITGFAFTILLLPVVVLYAKWIGPLLEDRIVPEVRTAVYGEQRARTGGGTATATSKRPTREEEGAVEMATYDPVAYLGEHPKDAEPHKVGTLVASLPLIVPLLLIVLNTVTGAIDKARQDALTGEDYVASDWVVPFAFFGNPVVALVIGTILAVYVLLPRWTPRNKVHG